MKRPRRCSPSPRTSKSRSNGTRPRVSEYRLIGYETRALEREDFNNDRVDAGDIGSGHTVTAIYEVTPVGAPRWSTMCAMAETQPARSPRPRTVMTDANGELGFLKLRYKRPNEDTSKLMSCRSRMRERAQLDAAPPMCASRLRLPPSGSC